MTTVDASPYTSPHESLEAKPLSIAPKPSLAPAICLVAIYWVGRLAVTAVYPGTFTHVLYLFWTPLAIGVALLVWLLFFSRLSWLDRGWSLLCLVGGGALGTLLADKSMTMGMYMYALPTALTVLVAWLIVTQARAVWPNRIAMLAAMLAAWGYYTLVRIDGIAGSLTPQASWRWDETAEERFLAGLKSSQADGPIELVPGERDWPAFRGAARDGAVHGIKLHGDWDSQPPRQLWRRRVGPNWSSIAVVGDYGFTQEQRDQDEAVVCFDLGTGVEAWSHRDKTRFWEVVAGAGPRATPTYHAGKLYTQGASGRLNCLDAATGKVIWTRDVAAEATAQPPQWGYSSSPLVAQGVVVAYAGGKDGKSLLAYDAETGESRWSGGKATHSYSSPQLWTSGEQEQVLFVSDFGLESFDLVSGKLLWEHNWKLNGIFRVVQPLVTRNHGILLGTGMGYGTRQLTVQSAGSGNAWNVEEGWTSKDLKPYFNDFVEYGGHVYGFDGAIFTCIDLETGKRNWKEGRYGDGQVLLVADSGHLVVVTETTGEIVLLEANPDEHMELGRLQALPGKTWNHPVITGDRLLVRNGEEMACYELTLEAPDSGVSGK